MIVRSRAMCMIACGAMSTLLVAAAVGAPQSAREVDDRLAIWLEREGLDRLLASHFEQRLSKEVGDADRRDMAERLRDVLVRLLRRGELEPAPALAAFERMRASLTTADADEFLLEVVRFRQRRIEERLDRLRLGRAAEDEGASIVAACEELSAEIDRLRRRLEGGLRTDDRKLDRSVGLEAEALLDDLDRKRLLLETARFVEAWTLLHLAMVSRSSLVPARGDAWRTSALAAREQFDALLDTGRTDPTLDDVAVDRRGEENYASALLGASLARLLLDGSSKAGPWFSLLAEERTSAVPRRSAPGWMLLALVLRRDFTIAKPLLESMLGAGDVPTSWLRAAIVESRSDEVLALPGALDFVQSALTALAAQDDLAEVISLASTLPASAVPSTGFLAPYLRGLKEYSAARGLGPEVSEAQRRDAFRAAAASLGSAAAVGGAARTSMGVGAARWLAGWCLVGASDFAEASTSFEQAAELLPASRAAESLWLASEAAERAMQHASGSEREAWLDARRRLVDRLIDRFPVSEFATRAEISKWRESGEQGSDGDVVARLRAVPRGSPAWGDALAAVEELLYRRIRRGTDAERRAAAVEYLALMRADDAPNPATRRIWLRRRAEAALVPGVDLADEAHSAVLSLRAHASSGEFEIGDIEPELQLRELQIAAIEGRLDDAVSMLRTFEGSSTAESPLVRLGRRAVLRGASRIDTDAARAVTIDVGAALFADEVTTLDADAQRAVAMTVGSAARALGAGIDGPQARSAFEVVMRARRARPNDLGLLELGAILADRVGEPNQALDCLRAILNGTVMGEPAWFDARVRQIEILARQDPAQARRVLDQHRALVPEWGPDPWGDALRQLDRRVPAPSGEGDAP